MADATGRTTSTYDPVNRRSTVTNPASLTITYQYDGVGRKSRMTAPGGGLFTYFYNADGQIDHLLNPQADRTTYAYDAAGRRTLKLLGNGTRTSYTYDAGDNLRTLANRKADLTTISSFDYQYDATGNRTSVVEVTGDRVTWTYDEASQLLSEDRSGAHAYSQTYTYDPAGNRTLKVVDGSSTTYAYDDANQLSTSIDSSGTTTYTFDADGNQQLVVAPNGNRTTTTWDYENLTTQILLPDATVATYTWNADNQRVAKNVNGQVTKMLWDEQNILLETDGNDDPQRIYTLEPRLYGNVVSQLALESSIWTSRYYHYDALGSTRNLTDNMQVVTDTWLYDAWGNIINQSGGTVIVLLWVGEVQYYYDAETGAFVSRVRIFKPLIARWTTTDPLEFSGQPRERTIGRRKSRGTCHEVNLYAYCRNIPTTAIDPLGTTTLLPLIPGLSGRWADTGIKFCDGTLHGYIKLSDGIGYGLYAESHIGGGATITDDLATLFISSGVVVNDDAIVYKNAPCSSIIVNVCCWDPACYTDKVESWVRSDYSLYNKNASNRRNYNVLANNCYTWRGRAAGVYGETGIYGPDLSQCRTGGFWGCLRAGLGIKLYKPSLTRSR